MGRHDPTDLIAPASFHWPELPDATVSETRKTSWRVEIPGPDNTALTFSGPVAEQAIGACLSLSLSGGGLAAVADLPLDLLSDLLGVPVADLDGVPPAACALLAEHALTPMLDGLEALCDAPVDCALANEHGAGEALWLTVSVAEDGAAHAVRLTVPPETARWIEERLAPYRIAPGPVAPPDDLIFQVALHTPSLALDRPELALFEPGDALILPDEWEDPPAATLSVAGRLSAPLNDRPRGLTLRGPLAQNSKETNMPTPAAGHVQNDKKTDTGIPGATELLPVAISVELDRAEMTLGQLGDLDVGAVLPFERSFSTDVRLIANGAPFAEGELVRLGEQVGVRITARL